MAQTDRLLEVALFVVSRALNDLVKQCTDERGQPMAPTARDLHRARGLLPPYCDQSLAREARRRDDVGG